MAVLRATHNSLKAIAMPRRGGSHPNALRAAILCKIKGMNKQFHCVPDNCEEIVYLALVKIATG
jgi:hypothetical protein